MKEEKRKVVVLACSGIGKVYGTIAREMVYELMERVRPGVVTTICLPLLMIDDPDAKKLVADNPVITIDGCPKCCSQKNLEVQGVKADRSFQAIKFYTAHKEFKPGGIVELDENGRKLVAISAEELAPIVDELVAGGNNDHP